MGDIQYTEKVQKWVTKLVIELKHLPYTERLKNFHYDIRKYSVTPRVVNIWNSLTDYVVDTDSINTLKSHYRQHCAQHKPPVFNLLIGRF